MTDWTPHETGLMLLCKVSAGWMNVIYFSNAVFHCDSQVMAFNERRTARTMRRMQMEWWNNSVCVRDDSTLPRICYFHASLYFKGSQLTSLEVHANHFIIILDKNASHFHTKCWIFFHVCTNSVCVASVSSTSAHATLNNERYTFIGQQKNSVILIWIFADGEIRISHTFRVLSIRWRAATGSQVYRPSHEREWNEEANDSNKTS